MQGCSSPLSSAGYYVDHTGQFEIEFPGEPTVTIDSTYTPHKYIISYSSPNDENRLYQLTFSDQRPEQYHSDSLKSIKFDLEYSQRQLMKQEGLKLISANPATIKGYPGREFRYEKYGNKWRYNTYVYIVESRLYELLVITEPHQLFNIQADEWFRSFTLPHIAYNVPSFLNLPSERELEEKPYEVDFPDRTTSVAKPSETDWGNVVTITETTSGLYTEIAEVACAVQYTQLPFDTTLTEAQRETLLDYEKNRLNVMFHNSKILNVDTQTFAGHKAIKMLAAFEMLGKPMCEINFSFVTKKQTYYVVKVIYRWKGPEEPPSVVDDFFHTFWLKPEFL